jgi:hypothetical protein
MRQIMAKFIVLDAIKSAEELTKVNMAKLKDLSLMFMNIVTKAKLNKLFNEGDISKNEKDVFLAGIVQFYCSVTKYGLEKLPLHDDVTDPSDIRYILVSGRVLPVNQLSKLSTIRPSLTHKQLLHEDAAACTLICVSLLKLFECIMTESYSAKSS